MDWLSSAITAVGGLTNSILGSSSNANLNAKNRRWQAEQNKLAFERQKELTMLSPSLQKQGLQMAGISPAAMNGYTGGTASVNSSNSAPSSLPQYVPFDFNSLVQGIQMQKLEADTKKTNEEAESLRLQNLQKRNEIKAWSDATSDSYYLDSDGTKHRTTDSDFNSWADQYVKTHGELPDLVKIGGVFSANAASVNSAMSNFRAQIAQSGMYEAQANLAKRVAQLKLGDRDVMSALFRMDLAQYNQLMAAVAKSNSDIDVNVTLAKLNEAKTDEARQSIAESVAREALYKTEKGQIENSSVNNLIDQLGGDKSTSQNLITVGKIILSILSGFSSRLSGFK